VVHHPVRAYRHPWALHRFPRRTSLCSLRQQAHLRALLRRDIWRPEAGDLGWGEVANRVIGIVVFEVFKTPTSHLS
jgi:hypothetical protein